MVRDKKFISNPAARKKQMDLMIIDDPLCPEIPKETPEEKESRGRRNILRSMIHVLVRRKSK